MTENTRKNIERVPPFGDEDVGRAYVKLLESTKVQLYICFCCVCSVQSRPQIVATWTKIYLIRWFVLVLLVTAHFLLAAALGDDLS